MNEKRKRDQQKSLQDKILELLNKYAYVETILIVLLYLFIGYSIDPKDICILHSDISYLMMLLAIITLFHGFENGVLAMSMIAFSMWYFYPSFEYIEFLMALMMTMIYSQFYYFWTKKIKSAEDLSTYRELKLDELTKAFYTLKISHEQLEKNYVVKPMSIRNSIERILDTNERILYDNSVVNKTQEYYQQFIHLLEKSFSVESAVIIYIEDRLDKNGVIIPSEMTTEDAKLAFSTRCDTSVTAEALLKDYLVDKALAHKVPIFVSNTMGAPSHELDSNSDFLAAIPSVQEGRVVSIMAIKRMPFMAFNRENLTSITILLEYFTIEVRNKHILDELDEISIVPDETFRFEFTRLHYLYKNYNVDSVTLVLRINNELQSAQLFEKIKNMLRSLDMVDVLHHDGLYYIILLFPLHDRAAAIGFRNRLHKVLEEERSEESSQARRLGKYKDFESMTFDFSEIALLNKYLRADYDS